MELYEVLEKRRTYRDYSDREVSDEILKRVIGAAFKAPTNDHLRQLEFIVSHRPACQEYGGIYGTGCRGGRIRRQGQNGDVRRRPAQTAKDAYGERAAHYPVFSSIDLAAAETLGAKLAQLFRLGMVCIGKYAAGRHSRGIGNRVPYSREQRS